MKKIGYIFFAVIFNLCRILPIQKWKIVLFNGHNHGLNGNLLEIQQALERKQDKFHFSFLQKRTCFQEGLPER